MRMLSLLLLVTFSPSAFADAREGNGGGINHGGGGTFVSINGSSKIVFWDLFGRGFEHMEDPQGDILSLSPEGNRDGGEWISPLKIPHAYGLMEKRLALWKVKIPKLSAALARLHTQSLNLLGTKLHVQAAVEVAPKEWRMDDENQKLMGIPGAFFNYDRRIVYLDEGIWNQVGVTSQAALLLHEKLRGVQLRYPELSNYELEDIVENIMLNNEPNVGKLIDDDKFDERFYHEPERVAPPRSPHDEMEFATSSGILGDVRGDAPIHPNGKRNREWDEGGEMLFEPLTCERRLKEIMGSSTSFRCEGEEVRGEGRMSFSHAFKYQLDIDAGSYLEAKGQSLKFEVLRNGTGPGIPISFVNVGEAIQISIGARKATFLPDRVGGRVNIRISRERHVIEVFRRDMISNAETGEVLLLTQPLSRQYWSANTFKEWTLDVSGGASIRYLRANTEYDPNTP